MKNLLLTLWLRLTRPAAAKPDIRRRLRGHYHLAGPMSWALATYRRSAGRAGNYVGGYVLAYVAAEADKADEARMQQLVREARVLAGPKPATP